ncbi:MAG: radical SAM protein [Candidatus Omnitrophica bacterium]|nr:radical SAM protein [Candidatus Omnitrophota bacterium]
MRKRIDKVLLVNPPSGLFRRDARCQSSISTQTAKIYLPPVDLLQLAAILQKRSIVCKIRDYPVDDFGKAEILTDINEFGPGAILINASGPSLKKDFEYLSFVKRAKPEILTIVKGGCFINNCENYFFENKDLDIIIRQQQEETIYQLAINDFVPNPGIKGIAYRKNGKISVNPDYSGLAPLDKFPFPARELINNYKYTNPYNGKPLTVINVGNGCNFRCTFCLAGILSGYNVSYRDPENVLGEIEECVRCYGIKDYLFNADNFTHDRKWVYKLCSLIKKNVSGIRWACNSRADTVDKDLLYEMKDAGCWIVGFGIESGSQDILDKINKGVTLEQCQNAIRLCSETGILSHAFLMIGFPWDSKDTVKETEQFIKKNNPDYFDVNIACPLPGTEFYNFVDKNGLITGLGDSNYSYSCSCLKTFFIAAEELDSIRKKIILRMLLRPGYILRTMRKRPGSPILLKNMLLEGSKRIIGLLK